MKTMRKVLLGASVGALALVAVSGIDAEAATLDQPTKSLKSLAAGDSVSFDAVKVKSDKPEYNPKAKWDLYTESSNADLSNVKTTGKKPVYFATQNAAGTTVDIYKAMPDTQKKFKASCDGTKITITVGTAEVKDTELKNFSWRTENSAWTAFQQTDVAKLSALSAYTMQGATIYIRYTGDSTKTVGNSTETVTVPGLTNPVTVKEIPADYFPEKEFKVKVPKKANAPVINVDYVKGVIKKNAKAVTAQVTGLSALSNITWSAKMTADLPIDNSTAGATILMQIPEDTVKKKPASKIAFFTYKAAETAPAIAYSNPPKNDATTGAISGDKKGDIIAGKLSYEATDNKNVAKATFKISNNTSGDDAVTYEIFKAKSGSTTEADGKAVATIKPGKSVVLTSAKVSADTVMLIRVTGDKAKATLPGKFASSATLKPVYLKTPEAAS